jgi:hypothetical protein
VIYLERESITDGYGAREMVRGKQHRKDIKIIK